MTRAPVIMLLVTWSLPTTWLSLSYTLVILSPSIPTPQLTPYFSIHYFPTPQHSLTFHSHSMTHSLLLHLLDALLSSLLLCDSSMLTNHVLVIVCLVSTNYTYIYWASEDDGILTLCLDTGNPLCNLRRLTQPYLSTISLPHSSLFLHLGHLTCCTLSLSHAGSGERISVENS